MDHFVFVDHGLVDGFHNHLFGHLVEGLLLLELLELLLFLLAFLLSFKSLHDFLLEWVDVWEAEVVLLLHLNHSRLCHLLCFFSHFSVMFSHFFLNLVLFVQCLSLALLYCCRG